MSTPLSRQMDQMADAQEWKERAEQAEAEVERLKSDLIRNAAERLRLTEKAVTAECRLVEMYERIIPEEIAKGCAAAEAENARLRADIERVRGWAFEHGYGGLEEQLRAALRGGGE